MLVVVGLVLQAADELLASLVEPPDVAAERVFVSECLHAVLAGHQVSLGPVHVSDVAGESVPGELLETVRTGLLTAAAKDKSLVKHDTTARLRSHLSGLLESPRLKFILPSSLTPAPASLLPSESSDTEPDIKL